MTISSLLAYALVPFDYFPYTSFSIYFSLPLWLLIGAVFGSFINMLCFRLPLQLELVPVAPAMEKRKDLYRARSFCPSCLKTLAPLDLIPLVSYLLRKGRCAYCHSRIGKQHFYVEAFSAVIFVLLAHLDVSAATIFWLMVFFLFGLPLALIDARTSYLPDPLTYGLLWAGLLANSSNAFTPSAFAVLSVVFIYAGMQVLCAILSALMGRTAMGMGDIKLYAACGAWLGAIAMLHVFILSSLFGIAAILLRRLFVQISLRTPMPFGPSILLAAFLVLLSSLFL